MNINIKSIDSRAGNDLETFVRERVKEWSKQCNIIIRTNEISGKRSRKNPDNK